MITPPTPTPLPQPDVRWLRGGFLLQKEHEYGSGSKRHHQAAHADLAVKFIRRRFIWWRSNAAGVCGRDRWQRNTQPCTTADAASANTPPPPRPYPLPPPQAAV